jgi:hypothetical protein
VNSRFPHQSLARQKQQNNIFSTTASGKISAGRLEEVRKSGFRPESHGIFHQLRRKSIRLNVVMLFFYFIYMTGR